ncbi:uncharacterized protein LOC130785416 isoform X2 [Actinidia eriantha]|uniref:uncharacterized protein LOC130785416 isoform X2 n=1 Tax=Actinidia eriantha TaxID=165200 RepID=UPI0025866208|nr:uncharacterized protein LOC130785416 isoform X2 [Actinidia eriantha]
MPRKKKRKRAVDRPTIHFRNKYSDNLPDFGLLASLYPSFEPFVFNSRDGRPRIDWTDFNATRKLTRVFLLHDDGLNWGFNASTVAHVLQSVEAFFCSAGASCIMSFFWCILIDSPEIGGSFKREIL